ncbi:hypothetical protein LIER_04886 [Lithospermum erythrorhizon]|uniref:Remorin C-terminal domain-containing protein n=1 Tax=Lithospermum erythrorhizon TaxID=34254 RepID=A0AAV3P151_LITER
MRRNLEVSDPEYVTALAASAFAVHCLEESNLRHHTKELRPARSLIGQPLRYDAPPPPRPVPRPREDQRRVSMNKGQRIAESKAEAWEKTQMAKIIKRYERLHSAIHSWEKEKKLKAKQQMERKKMQGMVDTRRANMNQHYQDKLARIEHIANGARKQAEEKRKHEESVVKEKAKRIRLTGQTPVTCFCC